MSDYPNPKTSTALDAIAHLIDEAWSDKDWRDLALACIDQAGFPPKLQTRVSRMLIVDLGELAQTMGMARGADPEPAE